LVVPLVEPGRPLVGISPTLCLIAHRRIGSPWGPVRFVHFWCRRHAGHYV